MRVDCALTDAADGLLSAFKEILSWSRLHGDARCSLARGRIAASMMLLNQSLSMRVDILDATRNTSRT